MILRRLKLTRTYPDIHDVFQKGNRGNCETFSKPAVCGAPAFARHVKRIGNEDAANCPMIDASYAGHIAPASDGLLVERLLDTEKSIAETTTANGSVAVQLIKKVAETGNNISLKQPTH
ncbi:hypothetical protein FVF58_33710 [Paraburkholderia panacisoli]|uniref:Uncharacterized protein n=1 Tax=Paraburkholderia panacisoli TaxID=2603818 RepID=A0A5B0GPU1_9BURK|nr:hypothetical protein [Paraburkholderia panacisoli]KAA1004089.1 hypothetical protein FVF58_33710 [Paraburkholderia panacisoli]